MTHAVRVALERFADDDARAALLNASTWRDAYPSATDANSAAELLKAEYFGWMAVEWVRINGQELHEDVVAPLKGVRRVRAGNSDEKALWKERALYVQPLRAYYRLPARVPQWVLRSGVQNAHFPAVVAPDAVTTASAPQAPGPFLTVFANKPGVFIDRATRGTHGWDEVTLQYRDAFEETLALDYFEEDAAPEQLRQQLMTLDPRTSDVWRLLTARALEADGDDVFAPITIRPDELARALGLKPHPKGGMRGKDLVHCSRSLHHLERLWLTMPDTRFPDRVTRKRVLAVMERGYTRQIDGQFIPNSWTVVLGEWAKYFPKSYAPIFRSLVELPANSATNLWAKQVGTELTYLVRETADLEGDVRFVSVHALLERASLLNDVNDMRANKNFNRALERLEGTLDLLHDLGVHDGWRYVPDSAALLDRLQGKPEFYDAWLQSVIEIRVPAPLLAATQALVERTSRTR
ncbi:hypothetical protein DES52_12212 [Deinococcus yavapaiensis KR-236]|uniref:Uncharacterized protein n=2 Tax=Deinococcus TaxID=1298 RepID=A0A318S118_9DEIO|nr:hypothetical protein DES52_12212 [Deinococcus yavapaiensis KR-236]